MTTAHYEAIYIAPNVKLAAVISDDRESRVELHHQLPGEEPQCLVCVPIPADALALVAALLSRAAEAVS